MFIKNPKHVLQLSHAIRRDNFVGAESVMVEMSLKLLLPLDDHIRGRVALEDIVEALDRVISERLADEGPAVPTTPDGRPRRRLLS